MGREATRFPPGRGTATLAEPMSRIDVVVTHGDTLRVARAVLAGRTHREVEWGVIGNGEVVTLSV